MEKNADIAAIRGLTREGEALAGFDAKDKGERRSNLSSRLKERRKEK